MVKPKRTKWIASVRIVVAIVDATDGGICTGANVIEPDKHRYMQGANPCPHSKTISDQADRGCNGGPIGVAIIVRQ